MNAVQTIEAACGSVEEFCEVVGSLGWDSRFHQLDVGGGSNILRAVAGANTAAMHMQFTRRQHQRAVPPKGLCSFGIPDGPQRTGRIANRALEADKLIYMDPADGLDAVIESGFKAFTYSISEQRLCALAELHEMPDPLHAQPGSERELDDITLRHIRHLLHEVMAIAASGMALEEAERRLEFDIPEMILRGWFGANQEGSGVNTSARGRALARARGFLEATPWEPVTVEQLCQEACCSISTLERAFKEHFGVSPKRYLILSRLSGVRRALIIEKGARSITDLANEWGFWHMGKFAADYRRAFGELPSRTLAA